MTRAARGVRHATRPAGPAVQAAPGASAYRPAVQPAVAVRPAPFGIADELSCYYDAPAEPCNVHIEVRVPGHLDAQALRDATAAALAAQPRALARRAARAWWQRYAWEAAERPDCDPVATAAWAGEQELARLRAGFLAAAPPLRSAPPLRILLAAGPGEDRVILNAHHAALDGLSSLDLLRAVARHYPGAAPGGPQGPAGNAPAVPALAGLRSPRVRPGRAARIAADRPPGRAAGLPGYGFLLLPGQPVPAGREHGGTVNDLLIAGLIAAIGRWNAEHGRPPRPIRITMPVNARPPGQADAAGNLSRLAAVSVPAPAGGCGPGDLGVLVADVAAQTRAAKERAGPQVDPVSRALAAAWCPPAVKRGALRLALRTAGPLLCDTSLVSNLGVVAAVPRFGSAAVTGMWFSTSAHMPRGLSVGAVTVGGRLHLCLRYRRALFSEPSAARFAGLYATALADLTSHGGAGDR